MITKKTDKKGNSIKSSTKKGVEAAPKDTQMRNAFIRVSKINMTGEDNSIAVTYTKDQIKDTLDFWAFESGLTYWFIEHNPDEEDTNPHFHIVLSFRTNSRFSTIKGKFPFGYIEPIKSTIKKTVQYLVHLNDPSKLAYNWEDVITNGGDLSAFKVQSKAQEATALQSVYDLIESGDITELNMHEKISKSLYANNKTKIINAFEHQRAQFFTNPGRDIRVAFFEGKHGGEGKTEFIKGYCERLNLTCCVSSSSNDPLQDYKGEDVLILDDLRDNAFKFHDLVKLLDNFTKSSTASRYHNKMFMGRIIAITSNKFLYDWYPNITEDKHPLYRRITDLYRFDNGRIFHYTYDRKSTHYEPRGSSAVPNWCTHIDSEQKTLNMFEDLGLDVIPDTAIKHPRLEDTFLPTGSPTQSPLMPPRNSNPLPGCELIQYNGKHVSKVKSITQIKIEESQPLA